MCATNRKQDLDAAVLSRFDLILSYDLPDKDTRMDIFKRYAKQFSPSSYDRLADAAEGLSCREIKEACEQVLVLISIRTLNVIYILMESMN